jgi:hypothetical protein
MARGRTLAPIDMDKAGLPPAKIAPLTRGNGKNETEFDKN